MSIEFVSALPDTKGGPGSLSGVRDALIARPGEWAIVKRLANKKASGGGGYTANIKRVPLDYTGWTFETTTRQDGPDVVIYARAVTS